MFEHKFVRTSLSLALCCSLASCATIQESSLGKSAKENFNSDDPCSDNARNWGIVIGTVAGAVAGHYLGDKKTGVVVGAGLAGAALGGLIGADMDRKRCELSKIAKQYNLQIEMATVDANGDVIENGGHDKNDNSMGLTVTLGEKDGRGHFETDSDQLSPKAKLYFAAIADTYNPQLVAKQFTDPKERAAYLEVATHRKLLLIGHTDDAGDTKYNASLSERRARTVAKFLKEHGVSEDTLYFQGAGESLPKADNRTEDGRAQNRRVEIVEVTGEANFQKYLEARKPKHEYYRSVDPVATQTAKANERHAATTKKKTPSAKSENLNAASSKAGSAKTDQPTASTTVSNSPSQKITMPEKTAGSGGKQYNFGGQPFVAENAKVDLGKVIQEEAGFSLISKAYAEDAVALGSCNRDRPRASGVVKSLKDGKAYATTEYLTGLYNTSWHDTLNGNLVMLNRVAILSDSAAPANPPEFKIYAAYDPQKRKTAKPDIQLTPAVNTYRGSKGVLYRVFTQGAGGIQCMDVLFPGNGGMEAKTGKLLYSRQNELYIADYKPKMIR